MRHRKKKKTLDRPQAQRKALIKNLLNSLILHEKIKTTEAKAKVLRPQIERMVTRAKKDNLHNRREIIKKLPTKNAVKKIFEVIGPRYKERAGGYTRIVKLPARSGDGAKMAIIEFI